MATVTVMTAERMQEIEDQAVVGGTVVDNHLILERHNGTTFDAGAIEVVESTPSVDVDTQFYRYSDPGTPLPLAGVLYTYSQPGELLMNVEDNDPLDWGHWNSTYNALEIDTPGLYHVKAEITVDSSGSVPGASTLRISGTVMGSGNREVAHVSGVDTRIENQLTLVCEVGHLIYLYASSTHAINVTYAELNIIKMNI